MDVDYGPLAGLIGTWSGAKGWDLSPEPTGEEESAFQERIVFEPVGSVSNARQQRLAALRYHQSVQRLSDGAGFHDETGYWLWDASEGQVIQSFTIPRGVCVLAMGFASETDGGQVELQVQATADNPEWSIIQSPFMAKNAKTLSFEHRIKLAAGQLSYSETMVLDIYGRRFDHCDSSFLSRED